MRISDTRLNCTGILRPGHQALDETRRATKLKGALLSPVLRFLFIVCVFHLPTTLCITMRNGRNWRSQSRTHFWMFCLILDATFDKNIQHACKRRCNEPTAATYIIFFPAQKKNGAEKRVNYFFLDAIFNPTSLQRNDEWLKERKRKSCRIRFDK